MVKGRGRPACARAAVSAREIRLAAELAAVLPGLDVDDRHILPPGRRALEADILNRQPATADLAMRESRR